jgi:DNA-binding transcriptional regulator YdaS (Cro superfamily)
VTMNNKYTDAFVAAMDQAGIRSRTLAAHVGNITDNSIAQWRSGRRPIPAEHAPKIAKLLNVPPETISQQYEKLLHSGTITSAAPHNEAWANPPAGHAVIERLPGFGRADEQARIWLPEQILRRELGATPIEHVRWATQQARTMEPEIKRHALVLVDTSATRLDDVVDGAVYAYALWGRSDIRRITIRRDAWVLVGDNEERARTSVPIEELAELQLLGMVIGWL